MNAQIPVYAHVAPDAAGGNVPQEAVLFKIFILLKPLIVAERVCGRAVRAEEHGVVFIRAIGGDQFAGENAVVLDREIGPLGIGKPALPRDIQLGDDFQPLVELHPSADGFLLRALPRQMQLFSVHRPREVHVPVGMIGTDADVLKVQFPFADQMVILPVGSQKPDAEDFLFSGDGDDSVGVERVICTVFHESSAPFVSQRTAPQESSSAGRAGYALPRCLPPRRRSWGSRFRRGIR